MGEPNGARPIGLEAMSPVAADDAEHARGGTFWTRSPTASAKTLDQAVVDHASVYSSYDPQEDYTGEGPDEDSPYPEVRSAVSNVDDPMLPVSTVRAWTLGIFWALILPGINEFFHFRYPSLLVSGLIAVLLSYPLGRFWARVVPDWHVFGVALNPGDFTIKEHVLITIMGGVASNFAYATDIIAVQRTTYQEDPPFAYQWLLVMSTQLWGYSIGGLAQRCLVEPASMIWPNNLVLCALFNTLHSAAYTGAGAGHGMRRERLFALAFVGAGIWALFPSYLFSALSWFTWVCWIAPNNVRVNQVFGVRSGMGLSVLTFDWNQIAFLGSPLATPWWVEVNVLVAFIFFYWFLTPILYYSNVWNGQFMPLFSNSLYDNTGKHYDVHRILDSAHRLNTTAYHAYSPPFLPTSFAVSYGVAFAAVAATLSHAVLYFRQPIYALLRGRRTEPPDVHARLMAAYAPVPDWWYGAVFVVCFVFAIACTRVWETEVPVWAIVVALLLALVYVIPVGMITAVTNFGVGLNVITELIVGYALPGRPVAMMMFKTWGYIGVTQAISYLSDFKLGHYMKIPPRTLFWAQIVATVVAGTSQLGIQSWMFTNIHGLCMINQKQSFICAGTQTFATASIFWGVIGPHYSFSPGYIYHDLTYWFLIGALAPVVVYLLHRRWPNSIFGWVNVPLMLAGIGDLPPATAFNYVPWAFVGFLFQYHIRQKHFLWWAKYNYVLSAAFDAGTAVTTVLIYFCLQYPQDGMVGLHTIQSWWGNTVFANTLDWNATAHRTVEPGSIFGPATW